MIVESKSFVTLNYSLPVVVIYFILSKLYCSTMYFIFTFITNRCNIGKNTFLFCLPKNHVVGDELSL